MNTFKAFFILETKRFLSFRNLVVVFGVFLLLSVYLVQTGVNQYHDVVERKKEFREVESLKVKQIVNYDQYGAYGLRLFFMPCSLSTLFHNSSHFTELTCRIDSGEKLNIYSLFKGKKVFAEKPGKLFDFSGLFLILGSLIALYYGYDSYRKREYIKFLASLYGHRQTFLCIWLSRVILLCISFFLITLIALLMLICQIEITNAVLKHLSLFFLVMLLMQIFFFTVGSFASSLKQGLRGFTIVVFWISSVFLIPAMMNKIVEARAENITSYYISELRKLNILMPFEKEGKRKTWEMKKKDELLRFLFSKINKPDMKILKSLIQVWINETKLNETPSKEKEKILNDIKEWTFNILLEIEQKKENETIVDLKEYLKKKINEVRHIGNEIAPKMAHRYLKEEFLKIQEVDEELLFQMQSNIDYFQGWFRILPFTFYLATSDEISSRGYGNIIEFYKKAITLKHEFLKFYVRERYGDEPEKIKSFIEKIKEEQQGIKEANVYKAPCQLPANFGWGILITLLWILFSFISAYWRFRKTLFSPPDEDIPELNDLEIELTKGESNVVLCRRKITVSNHLYNVLSGENKKFTGKVVIEGEDVVKKKTKTDFFYLCQSAEIPYDIKVTHFISFIARNLKLTPQERKSLEDKLNVKNFRRKKLRSLREKEKGRILMEVLLLNKKDILMFHDFAKGMPADFIKEFREQLQKLKEEGVSILYITNDAFLGRKLGDYVSFPPTDEALMTIKF